MLLQLALAGAGILRLSEHVVARSVRAGLLQPSLQDVQDPETYPLFACCRRRSSGCQGEGLRRFSDRAPQATRRGEQGPGAVRRRRSAASALVHPPPEKVRAIECDVLRGQHCDATSQGGMKAAGIAFAVRLSLPPDRLRVATAIDLAPPGG